MVRHEVRGDVEDRGVQGPSTRSIGHRARRTPRACRPIPRTRAFGPSPIGVQEARARSRRARSVLIWEIPAQGIGPALGKTARAGRGGHWRSRDKRFNPVGQAGGTGSPVGQASACRHIPNPRQAEACPTGLGSALWARFWAGQKREIILPVVTHNIMLLAAA